MAKKVVRRSARNTRTGANAMAIQNDINRDFANLFEDYKKLSVELWRKPVTKYVVGGIALASLVPVVMKVWRNFPEIQNKVSELGGLANQKIADLKAQMGDDVSNL